MVAISNFLPFPPLALGRILEVFIPERYRRFKKTLSRVGPYFLTAALIIERISGKGHINDLLLPIFSPLLNFFTKSYALG
jgi:hypothetical protein